MDHINADIRTNLVKGSSILAGLLNIKSEEIKYLADMVPLIVLSGCQYNKWSCLN